MENLCVLKHSSIRLEVIQLIRVLDFDSEGFLHEKALSLYHLLLWKFNILMEYFSHEFDLEYVLLFCGYCVKECWMKIELEKYKEFIHKKF